MSKGSSAKYYFNNKKIIKKRLQKELVKDIKLFLKTKTKNKSRLSIGNDIIKREKTHYL